MFNFCKMGHIIISGLEHEFDKCHQGYKEFLVDIRVHIHDVSAFTIGNTLTEHWRGVRVMRSNSSIDKCNFLCVFDYILHAPQLTT